MTARERRDITILLSDSARDQSASTELLELVYDQLKRVAQQRMNDERAGHTLEATALVHEAYLRLIGDRNVEWANRAHFFAAAAEAMRRILIEHARARACVKRGGDGRAPALRQDLVSVLDLAADTDPDTIVNLDEAISRLEKEDAQLSAIVRLRFYAGLTVDDTAAALDLSSTTVQRRWAFARAWLFQQLSEPTG